MTIKKKVVLLGESSVGKTSLVRRFVFDAFEDHYVATIGGKVSRKDLQLERPNGTTNVALMVWDLIGREGYVGFHARTFAGTSGAILVADLTRRDTLESLEKYWIPLLVKVAGPIPVVVAGNKSDLPERAFGAAELATLGSQVSPEASRALPANLETNYLTSAKTGSNVEKAFEALGHLVLGAPTPDPVRRLYQDVVAMGLRRSSDATTPVGALDAIIVDFCEGFDDTKLALVLLRQEIARAGVNINDPDPVGILRAVDFLSEAEAEFRDPRVVADDRERRRRWALEARR